MLGIMQQHHLDIDVFTLDVPWDITTIQKDMWSKKKYHRWPKVLRGKKPDLYSLWSGCEWLIGDRYQMSRSHNDVHVRTRAIKKHWNTIGYTPTVLYKLKSPSFSRKNDVS